MKWKLFAAVVVSSVVSVSVAVVATSAPTVITGTVIDQVKVKRGANAAVDVPISENPGSGVWTNVPGMAVVMSVPSTPPHFAIVSLHTEDVPHVTDGSGRHVDYRLVFDGQPMRTDLLPIDRPILGSFDSTGVLAAGNRAFQVQVLIPNFYCQTPSCGVFPGEPLPKIRVSFDAPWQLGVQRVVASA
jgi:hypothetical protein